MNIKITHKIKILPKYYQAVLRGDKTFEIRKNDRDYKVGDNVLLMEYDTEKQEYTNRTLAKMISYITDYEQKEGYIVFALREIPHE